MITNIREVKLPSGAILKIRLAPFAQSKALYQAILKELKLVSLEKADKDTYDLMKDLFCVGLSSPSIDTELSRCMEHCQYDIGHGGLKIDKDTFESQEARGDYFAVCMEVAKDNISPFMKSLYAQFEQLSGAMTKIIPKQK